MFILDSDFTMMKDGMGQYRYNRLITVTSILAGCGIFNVNAFSPTGIHQFPVGRYTPALNLARRDSGPSKLMTKPAPSIAELEEKFSWKLPSITPQQESSQPSPTPATDDDDNTKRNLLAGGALLLLGATTLLPSLSGISTLLSDKFADTGFYQAFSLVFVSEIGDKTFFIAGLLAAQSGRLLSFLGSISALAVMTVLSVVIGQLFHSVPAGLTQGLPLDDIAAVIAFAFFGVKTLMEAAECEDDADGCGVDSEFAEAEEDVEGSGITAVASPWTKIASIFGLVFAAEFGDRSFLSTIALSAAQNPFSVGVGSVAAHAIATGIAVTTGSYVAKYISERTIGYIGGTLFIIFAITTALGLF